MLAVFINVLWVVCKVLFDVWIVMFGVGAVGMVIFILLLYVGVRDVVVCDVDGVVVRDWFDVVEYFDWNLVWVAVVINLCGVSGMLCDVLVGADVFIGVFVFNLFIGDDIVIMVVDSIVFAMVNLDLEVDLVEVARYVVVVVIGWSDFVN